MGIFRWKLKSLAKVVVILFFVSVISLSYINETALKTKLIDKAIGSRNVKEMVKPFEETFLINNNWQRLGGNAHVTEKDEVFLVVVITSLPDNEYRRKIIRSSWMKYNPERRTVVVFFTGRPKSDELSKLQKESDDYGDIIVDDFDENYYGLAVKTLRILKWFNMNFASANFLVKTDDDVYLSTPRLIEHLESVNHRIRSEGSEHVVNYMGGVRFSGRSPHTFNSFSKWYVPPVLWKAQKSEIESITKKLYNNGQDGNYPDYLEGNFYVISGYTVPLLVNASLQLPLFHLEDIYLTGFIGSEILHVKYETIPNLFTDSATWPRLNYFYNKLFVSPKDIIVYHCDNNVDIIHQIYVESVGSEVVAS